MLVSPTRRRPVVQLPQQRIRLVAEEQLQEPIRLVAEVPVRELTPLVVEEPIRVLTPLVEEVPAMQVPTHSEVAEPIRLAVARIHSDPSEISRGNFPLF